MLGYRIFYDDFGSPYIRSAGVPITDPTFLEWRPAIGGGMMRYIPKWEPDPSYASWPARAREIVPEEWSGDLMRGGPGSFARGASDRRLTIPELVWDWNDNWTGPGAVNPGDYQLALILSDLQSCGWGRWVGTPSKATGRPEPCIRCVNGCGLDLTTLGRDISDHFRAVGGKVGMVLRLLAKIVSWVPGVGTIAAALLAGIGSLAAGEPIDAAILDSVVNAVPGGGIAKDAARSGIAVARKLIEGGSISEAALAGARSGLQSAGVPAEAIAAFDIGVAVGTGKGLQEAGFRALALFVPGNDIIERGLAYTKAIARSVASAIPIERVLEDTLGEELSKVDASGLTDAIAAFAEDPARLAMGSYELADKLGLPEVVARTAQIVMSEGAEDYALRDRLLAIADKATMDRILKGVDVLPDAFRAEKDARDAALLRTSATAITDTFRAEKEAREAREAAQLHASVYGTGRNYAYEYLLQTGVDVTAQQEIARRAAEEAALTTTTAPAPARESRSTTGQDIALGITVGGALAALYLWARS